jgi:hypothetical protein
MTQLLLNSTRDSTTVKSYSIVTMMRNNGFRSATHLRLLGRSRSNNAFAMATNLGSVLPTATSASFRASGTVDRSNSVDFYKSTVFGVVL